MVEITIQDLPVDISSVIKFHLPVNGSYDLNYVEDSDLLLCLVEVNSYDEAVSQLFVFGRRLNKAGAVESTNDVHWYCIYCTEVNKETFGQYRINSSIVYCNYKPFISFQRSNKTWSYTMINDSQSKVQHPNKLITSSTMPVKDIIFLAGKLGLELVYQEDNKVVFNKCKSIFPGNQTVFQQPQFGWQGDPYQHLQQHPTANINLVVNLIQEESTV